MLNFTALPTPLPQNHLHEPTTLLKPVTSANSFPCRRCLKDGTPGEHMLLLSYNPFPTGNPASGSPYAGPGPIYVHQQPCTPYQCDGSVPEQQRRRLLAVRAYDQDCMMVDFAVVSGEELEGKAAELLVKDGVSFLHVYYAGPGCFAVRIDRV